MLEGIGLLGEDVNGLAYRPNSPVGIADFNADGRDDVILHLVPDDIDALKTQRPASPILVLLNKELETSYWETETRRPDPPSPERRPYSRKT
jgi:hypothetical protein